MRDNGGGELTSMSVVWPHNDILRGHLHTAREDIPKVTLDLWVCADCTRRQSAGIEMKWDELDENDEDGGVLVGAAGRAMRGNSWIVRIPRSRWVRFMGGWTLRAVSRCPSVLLIDIISNSFNYGLLFAVRSRTSASAGCRLSA